MNHSQFTGLFREVAKRHTDIRHTEKEQHFARIVLTRDPFMDSKAQITEFVEKSKHVLKSPVLLISSYTSEYANADGDFVGKILTARMIILKETKKDNFEAEEQAFSDTEQIGEECLAWLNEFFEMNEQYGKLLWSHSGNEKLAKITDRNLTGTGFTVSIIDNNVPTLIYNPDKFIS